ncbi:hypothetical protein [Streptomyces canus]|uniref:hypothetical protein n=1 Tax=Streptomyces canus TaxID=58343 RepID=UPI002F915756
MFTNLRNTPPSAALGADVPDIVGSPQECLAETSRREPQETNARVPFPLLWLDSVLGADLAALNRLHGLDEGAVIVHDQSRLSPMAACIAFRGPAQETHRTTRPDTARDHASLPDEAVRPAAATP